MEHGIDAEMLRKGFGRHGRGDVDMVCVSRGVLLELSKQLQPAQQIPYWIPTSAQAQTESSYDTVLGRRSFRATQHKRTMVPTLYTDIETEHGSSTSFIN